ncbi:hypothetical protein D3X12_31155 [Pseudomonas protegens]|jgi:O-antigen/teichoic acid export membrane protein|uniref:Polysaccharide biosynthesis protein n=2 Tax=Pseudomonas protegens TaxID=380021 RepID=A0ABY2VF04_9PSED|nr:hypothetical protein [Pseudomonas protegens]AAY94324.1 putative O-unit flippase [Pseudomonas protegens Pf-5]AVK73701.1 hypothetical protein CEP86_13815 [Pseudomonas protegens]QEZ54817.1 hypothetical protein D3X12_31155 [Pseudomonas protegens]QEZ58985.1 hypothetical protein D4N38_20660 [Pseudomonas protegens]QEZ66102.1 hypothetical protein D4N37_26480 [Pseudomonas protegens]
MNLKSLFNKDFRHTAINQIWRLFSGPLLLVLLPLYLTPEAQGYWYTFVSLAALAIFADMGFSAILLLFSAHEFAHLNFRSDKTITGDEYHLIRLATLLRFSAKWSSLMALIVFPIVLIIGYTILNARDTTTDWKLAWLIYGAASVFVFINSMVLSFIEGCNSVGDVQKIRFHISVVTFITTLILLVTGASLYALSLSLLAGALAGTALITFHYNRMLYQLYQKATGESHPWMREIMPLIWRFAISWISGYFIFSIFTPLAFHYYGTIDAGKVGLSIAVCLAIFSIANIWITIITPRMNIYVAQKEYVKLNSDFNKHALLAIMTYILGITALYIALSFFQDYLPILDRLLPTASFLIIALAYLAQLTINSMAVYMRAQKKEPLVAVSVFNGIYVSITTALIAIYLPFEYFFLGFLSAYLIVLPWVYYLFIRHKETHS